MECNLENHQKTGLTSTWQPLVTTAISLVLPLGVTNLAPTAAVAQTVPLEVSATWAETITLTSILKGYESIALGLEEIGVGGEIDVSDCFITFSEEIAAFTLIGTIGDVDLVLNGNGSLFGDVGTQQLTWTGNWLGTLGPSFVTADDMGTFFFDTTDGYTELNFQQSGSQDFLDSWVATSTAILTSEIDGNIVPGWSGPGKGPGIGDIVSLALAEQDTLLFPSGNLVSASLIIDGDAQSYLIQLEDSTIFTSGNYSCDKNKNCIKTPIPESSPSGGLLLLLGIGITSQVKKFKA